MGQCASVLLMDDVSSHPAASYSVPLNDTSDKERSSKPLGGRRGSASILGAGKISSYYCNKFQSSSSDGENSCVISMPVINSPDKNNDKSGSSSSTTMMVKKSSGRIKNPTKGGGDGDDGGDDQNDDDNVEFSVNLEEASQQNIHILIKVKLKDSLQQKPKSISITTSTTTTKEETKQITATKTTTTRNSDRRRRSSTKQTTTSSSRSVLSVVSHHRQLSEKIETRRRSAYKKTGGHHSDGALMTTKKKSAISGNTTRSQSSWLNLTNHNMISGITCSTHRQPKTAATVPPPPSTRTTTAATLRKQQFQETNESADSWGGLSAQSTKCHKGATGTYGQLDQSVKDVSALVSNNPLDPVTMSQQFSMNDVSGNTVPTRCDYNNTGGDESQSSFFGDESFHCTVRPLPMAHDDNDEYNDSRTSPSPNYLKNDLLPPLPTSSYSTSSSAIVVQQSPPLSNNNPSLMIVQEEEECNSIPPNSMSSSTSNSASSPAAAFANGKPQQQQQQHQLESSLSANSLSFLQERKKRVQYLVDNAISSFTSVSSGTTSQPSLMPMQSGERRSSLDNLNHCRKLDDSESAAAAAAEEEEEEEERQLQQEGMLMMKASVAPKDDVNQHDIQLSLHQEEQEMNNSSSSPKGQQRRREPWNPHSVPFF